jgi:hypothetical protein
VWLAAARSAVYCSLADVALTQQDLPACPSAGPSRAIRQHTAGESKHEPRRRVVRFLRYPGGEPQRWQGSPWPVTGCRQQT